MARPKKPDSQRRGVQRLVRFTQSEDIALAERAKAAGMNVSDFLREVSLKRRFVSRPPLAEAEFLLFMRGEIGRAWTNLNRLLQGLETNQLTQVVSEAQTVINQLQEINTEVLRLLRNGHSWEKQG